MTPGHRNLFLKFIIVPNAIISQLKIDLETVVKILVVGAGALGSVFGCLLRDKGHEVGFLQPGAKLDDIRELGLTVTGLFGEHHCTGFSLYNSPDQVPTDYYDLILITVKSFHTREAVEQVAAKIGSNALVISLQNGLGNYEAIRKRVGEKQVLAARVIFGARIIKRAHSMVTVYAEPVMIGSPANAVEMSRIEQIARAFSEAGIPTEATREVNKYIWAKMLYNCTLNPLSGILNVPYGKLLEADGTKNLMRRIVEEIFAVAHAHNIALFWQEPQEYIHLLFGRLIPDTAAHFASMAQDLSAGRHTEIDAMNGAIVQLGEEVGVSCPVNATVSDLVKAMEVLRCGGEDRAQTE